MNDFDRYVKTRTFVNLDDVLKTIEYFTRYEGTYDLDTCKRLSNAINHLEKIKTSGFAEIETTSNKFHIMHQTCSNCGEIQPWKEYPKFCWNCGARFTNKECE